MEEFRKPGKQRSGSAIAGGIKREIVPGDVVHVPQMTPHQQQITPGKPFLYLLIHFDEEPLLPR